MSVSGKILEFGPYRLDIGRRLLTRDTHKVVLQPKTFELLVLLAEKGGEAFSKDDLMQALWPDTVVQEASITFQVSALRRALGEPGAHWIESVPKHGYRFTAPVTSNVKPEQPPPKWRKPAGAFVLAACILSAIVWFLVARQARETTGALLPLTTYAGLELHPSLSPDGSQVAFTWNGPNEDNFDIYVKLTGPGEPIPLTSDPANDFAPAWSPDGQWVAFLRGPEDGVLSVYVVPALGGAESKVTEIYQPSADQIQRIGMPNVNLAWAPDSRHLAVTGKLERSEPRVKLLLVDAFSGAKSVLTDPPPRTNGDFGPAFAADGRMLAFVRVQAPTLTELCLLPLDAGYLPAGEPRVVTAAPSMHEPRWMPGGRDIVFSAGPGLAPRRLFRVSSHETKGRQHLLPFGEDATTLSISRTGRMVYSRTKSDSNIWLLDTRQTGGNTKRVVASTMEDREPDYSPDGSRIVFTSTRSGTDEVWMSNPDGSNPKQLTHMNGPLTGNAQWSPDGNEIVFDSQARGLWLLNPKTLQSTQLCPHGSQPRWSPDGKWVYFNRFEAGVGNIWKTPREKCDSVRVTQRGGLNAQESADHKYLYYTKGAPTSLWRMALRDGHEERIAENLSYWTSFDASKDGVYFVTISGYAQKATLQFFDVHTNQTATLLETGKHWYFGIAVAPNGHDVLYSVVDAFSSDLMLLNDVP
jgi:Tol biopolymer transport system component/DNA-binding winged helix-turn-helix (wHTH) protein